MLQHNTSTKSFIITIASTKGGSTKSTNAANIGAYCAEHGLRTLLIDTDTQPTLSSYFTLDYVAPGGMYEFMAFKDIVPEHIISQTIIPNLDLIQSNDPSNKISPMLRDSTDGAVRFSHLLRKISGYDVIIIDTRGTRDITVDMAVLAADLLLCPILPHMLSAKEFVRGTVGIYKDLQTFEDFGFVLPPLKAVISCVDRTKDAGVVSQQLSRLFETEFDGDKTLLDIKIPAKVAYRKAATLSSPVYKHDRSEYTTIQTLCLELMPHLSTCLQDKE